MRSMETFTIREAAERCGQTYQAIRKRVDRGTVQAVKHHDGVRRIPRSELERTGLWPGSTPQLPDNQELVALQARVAELEALVSTRDAQLAAERQAREIAELAVHEERAGHQTAAAQLAEIEARAAEDSRLVSRLASGSVVERWRARRELRTGSTPPTAAATTA